MKQLNIIEIETRWGFKSFELYEGDITRLECPVDLLAVSVFVDDYYPLAGTVIGALHETLNIDLRLLLESCAFDFRSALSCWVSRELETPMFQRILCVELLGPNFDLAEVMQNVFAVLSMLEAKGIEIRDFALPLLGTGTVGLDSETVIGLLLHHSLEHLQRSQTLKRIIFVGHGPQKAQQLSTAMNETLGRVRVVLPRGEFADVMRQRTLDSICRLEEEDWRWTELSTDLRRVIADEESRSYELGIVARRLVECVAEDILGASASGTLFHKLESIKKASDLNVAEWIVIYMHVLRVMGNEAAHESEQASRVPLVLDESDLELCLLCIDRLIHFWLDFKGIR